jgi:hypothetical protein
MKPTITLFIILLLATSAALHAAEKATQPNVIVILADDLGWADLSNPALVARESKTPRSRHSGTAPAKSDDAKTQWSRSASCPSDRASFFRGCMQQLYKRLQDVQTFVQ